MNARPTALQSWALLLVQSTAEHLGRAPEPHEVCAHHKLPPPRAAQLKLAVRGLIRKRLIEPWPIVQTRPLRLTVSALALCAPLPQTARGSMAAERLPAGEVHVSDHLEPVRIAMARACEVAP